MTMPGRSVLIVGGGLAGLAAGCFAQMNGYQSQVFEYHSQAGGVAAAWQRGEYLIDGGIHFVMGFRTGSKVYELYRQLGIAPGVSCVPLECYGRFVDEASGYGLDLTRDLDRFLDGVRTLAPADAPVIEQLLSAARAMQGLDMSEFGLSKPPELTGPLDQAKDVWAMRRLLKYVTGRYAQPVCDFARPIGAPWLRTLVENLFLPTVPTYFLCLLLAMLADGQLGLLAGGCRDFVGAIERRYRDLGGKISYRATVEEILVEEAAGRDPARACGLRLHDGTVVRGDAVISAADGYSTLYGMLGGRFISRKLQDCYANWKVFRPLMMLSYGVAGEYPDEPAFTTIVLREPLQVAGEAVPGLFVRFFNYGPGFAPAGKTVVQVEFETNWDYWYTLHERDQAAYKAEKEAVAIEVLRRLEPHYPGIRHATEFVDVATPYTTWRYTLNWRGAWEGWAITPKTVTTLLPRTLPGLAGFYMAGQWVMPGGGVAPVLYSGRHAVQLLCRADGRPFVTATT
jgi:phytoene dehydrogenase-like protein